MKKMPTNKWKSKNKQTKRSVIVRRETKMTDLFCSTISLQRMKNWGKQQDEKIMTSQSYYYGIDFRKNHSVARKNKNGMEKNRGFMGTYNT